MTATATRTASDKQVAFARRLAEQIDAARGTDKADETVAIVASAPIREASRMIDDLLAEARDCEPEPAVGLYLVDGVIFRVQAGRQSGRTYAKELVVDGPSPEWVYVGRKPYRQLTEATALTAEQAAEFGHYYGVCAVCGLTLTNPESVERGIGPVCIKRLHR